MLTKEEMTAEKQRFCLELLDTMAWYYEEINQRNEKAMQKYQENNAERAVGIRGIFGYALSFIGKVIAVALGKGHWVDFETLSAYQKRKGLNNGKMAHDFALYIMGLCERMPGAIAAVREAVSADDAVMEAFYEPASQIRPNVIEPGVRGMLACGVALPYQEGEWDRYFYVGSSVVTRDDGEFTFDTRFKNVYRCHRNRMCG